MPSVNKLVAVILAVVIAGTSAFIIAPRMTDPANRQSTIDYLDEQQSNVAKITASTTALSVVLAALPTDAADPAANKLMDLTGYLVIVLCAVFLEKYLLIALSGLGFKFIIPFACLLFIIAVLLSRGKLKELAVKIAIMGLLVVTVIPASVAIGRSVDATYESLNSSVSMEEIEKSLNGNKESVSQNDASDKKASSTDTADASKDESKDSANDSSKDNAKDSSKDKADSSKSGNVWSSIKDSSIGQKFSDSAGKMSSKMTTAANSMKDKLDTSISSKLEEIKQYIRECMEKIALMIVTSCIIPILVILVMMWAVKILFGLDLFVQADKFRASKLFNSAQNKLEDESN